MRATREKSTKHPPTFLDPKYFDSQPEISENMDHSNVSSPINTSLLTLLKAIFFNFRIVSFVSYKL